MCQVPPIDSQWAPLYSRGRITSISASPIPIEPAVRTLFAKGLKIRIVPIAISMCQVPTIDFQRHRHLPEAETRRLVPLPFRSNRYVPSATDGFSIGTVIFPWSQSGPVCGPRRVNCASLRSGRGRPALGSPRAVFVIGQSGTVYTETSSGVELPACHFNAAKRVLRATATK